MRPALVVLAAGASTRLGTCKALVDLGGSTPLARLVQAAQGACDGPALVVTGPHHAALAAAAAALPVATEMRRNPLASLGRSGSVALGARARAGRDLCVAPVDVPLVSGATFGALASAWLAAGAPARGWLAPRFANRFGHPVVIGRELAAELATMPRDAPLRALRAAAEPLLSLSVPDRAVLDDLDTPGDLASLIERVRTP